MVIWSLCVSCRDMNRNDPEDPLEPPPVLPLVPEVPPDVPFPDVDVPPPGPLNLTRLQVGVTPAFIVTIKSTV
jgi:hypothetical protein